ncbi:mechanosensitive ion channel [Bifidobacterium sp. ESL0798]|uniref:mechanosensitive ion channel family protein n=1 Tax=unclassified Bifidobacterium TaxID=2608897 RepID=UPI0023F9129C|nr:MULTISPECIES: mechanosensitive ion channel domain-containing protein [unclassified Bifidobacterium]WEV53202.1 mechanosensitive ion channel [Bifidobacterium sp. ESL0704]WEV73818.1 mechanosensitive ion channel [Bifidobacterium sp. ESL0798]
MEQLLGWLKMHDSRIVFLVIVFVVAFVAAKVVSRWLKKLLNHSGIPNASIFVNLALVSIWIIAVAMVLQPVFGINPTTIVTALGIGGLAISLGLKDTIANIISGFGLMIGHVIHPGDQVRIQGITGTVEDITWRQTMVRERNGNQLIIPNSVLNTSSLERLTPEGEACVSVDFTVKPGTDIKTASKRIANVLRSATADITNRNNPPQINFTGFSVDGVQGKALLFANAGINQERVRDCAVRALAKEDFII